MKREEFENQMTREEIIQHGMLVFQTIGAHHICEVCIQSGNSCCYVCEHIEDGVGCQKRNTACTAWLCGLQKLLFQTIGLMDQWEDFWNQIPGQLFRKDQTPDVASVPFSMSIEGFDSQAGEQVAKWLRQYVEKGGDIAKLEGYLAHRHAYNRLEDVNLTQIDRKEESAV